MYLLLKGNLPYDFPGVVVLKDDSNPEKGSFEVYIGDFLIWSKKISGCKIPILEDIETILLEKGYHPRRKPK